MHWRFMFFNQLQSDGPGLFEWHYPTTLVLDSKSNEAQPFEMSIFFLLYSKPPGVDFAFTARLHNSNVSAWSIAEKHSRIEYRCYKSFFLFDRKRYRQIERRMKKPRSLNT